MNGRKMLLLNASTDSYTKKEQIIPSYCIMKRKRAGEKNSILKNNLRNARIRLRRYVYLTVDNG